MLPVRLNLKRTEKLEIEWPDGLISVYPIALLRKLCPCAECREIREQEAAKPNPLRILKSDPSGPLSVVKVEKVGGYAIRFDWSDGHGTGIYSFTFLREISPQKKEEQGSSSR